MSKNEEIRFAKPVEVEPSAWTVIATMPILRVQTDMGIQPDQADRLSIDEILDYNEFLDVRLDAQEAMRRAEIEHERVRAQVEAPPRAVQSPKPSRGAMMPRRPG